MARWCPGLPLGCSIHPAMEQLEHPPAPGAPLSSPAPNASQSPSTGARGWRRGRDTQVLLVPAVGNAARHFAGTSRSGRAVAQARQIPHSSSLRCAACLPSLHANSKQAVIIPDALNICGYFFSSQYSKKAKNSLWFLSQLFFSLVSFLSFPPPL